MLAAGAAALERDLWLRGAGLGLGAAAAVAAAVVVPLVGEVGFEDFGARFLTLSMRWRIALGVQPGRVLDGVRWGGERSGAGDGGMCEWRRGAEVRERLWTAGGVGEGCVPGPMTLASRSSRSWENLMSAASMIAAKSWSGVS